MKPVLYLIFGLLVLVPCSAVGLSIPPNTECKSTDSSVAITSGYEEQTTIAFHDKGYVTYPVGDINWKMEFAFVSSFNYRTVASAPYLSEFIVQFEHGDVLSGTPIGYLSDDCLAELRRRFEGKFTFTRIEM